MEGRKRVLDLFARIRLRWSLCIAQGSKRRCKNTYSEEFELSSDSKPKFELESLILAQNERWRSASDMQVERESRLRLVSKVAHG